MPTIQERKRQIVTAVDRLMPEAWALARRIFDLKEVSGEERESARLLTDRLVAAGASVERGIAGLPTAFCASFGSGTPRIALLAEYDALPDLGHACGHHLSGTASVFAAAALAESGIFPNMAGIASPRPPVGARNDSRGGTLDVIGTPMEEAGGGKILMLERGVFSGVDAVLMTHTSNETRAAYRTAAAQGFRITLTGGSSAHEWRSRNIMDVLLDMLNGIRVVENRAGVGTQILWVIPEGGEQNNVLPKRVVVDLGIWSFDDATLQRTVERIRSRVQSAVAGTTTAAAMEPNESLYLPLEPSEPLVAAFERSLMALGMSFEPRRGHLFDATDVGNVSHVVPTLHADVFLAGLKDHTPEYAVAGNGPAGERYLRTATAALALTTFDLLRDPDDIARAKKQLAEREQPKELKPGRLP